MMKNFFSKPKATVKPLGEATQKLPDKWSPKVIQSGIGFGLAWLTKQLGYTVFEIANTNSMLPSFDYDHLLYCRAVDNTQHNIIEDNEKIEMYGVYIYEDLSGALIVHRVVGAEYNKYDISSERFKFQGDNNLFSDGWIPRERIKYRVAIISYDR